MNLPWHYLAFRVDEVDVVDGTNVCVYCPTNETLAPYNMQGVATPIPGISGPGFSMQVGSQLTSAYVASHVHIAKSGNTTVSQTPYAIPDPYTMRILALQFARSCPCY